MGIVSVHNMDVVPGRADEAIGIVRDSKAKIERLAVGLEGVRLRHWTTAGPSSNGYVLSVEYADRASYAATLANEAEDDDFQQLAQLISDPNGPIRLKGHTLHTHLQAPIGGQDGKIAWVAIAPVKACMLAEAAEHARRANMLLLEAGAVQVALTQISVGGPITGSIVQVAEYADMEAWAEAGPGSDRMNGNPAWQELVQVALGPDGPLVAESLRINILTEVPL